MYDKWFRKYTRDLTGKRVAITGATGGLGVALCRHLARLGAHLVLCNRSLEKTERLIAELKGEYPHLSAEFVPLDLADMDSVLAAADTLATQPPHVLIHNAGVYAVPRYQTPLGVNNVYQIDCLAPYLLTKRLIEPMKTVGGHVVVVGSIAHNYSKSDVCDLDFSTRSASSLVYGNAKRHLMLAMYELFGGIKAVKGVTLSVVHPGITFTGITDHYPKWLFTLIKHPMKVLFMSPERAALSVVRGVFDTTAYGRWIGPWLLDVWGLPRKRKLHTFTWSKARRVAATLEKRL